MKNLILVISIFIGNFSPCIAQNFDRYTTLQFSGPMPSDWSTPTFEKIQNDKQKHPELYKDLKRAAFLEDIAFGVDAMLHSGAVIYGDPVSNYVTSVANRLMEDEPALKAELRFYTIKSNVTNAFSTRQGIIFVTTGLVSQLANEAQLAFVLAHEISHYKREHMLDRYGFNKSNRYTFSLEESTQFSQNHELEADADGIQMYHKAGYSVDELINSFDVLMYSYLPFDEVPFQTDFITYGKIQIPQKFNPGTAFPITAYEDYDDSYSSHPNIKKRKDAGLKIIADVENWGSTIYFEGEQNFINVRNIARFESIRTDIMEGEMGKALYSIFLLQQNGQFAQSHYLNEAKAFAWYGISRYNQKGNRSSIIPKKKEFEGESATLYNMISLLPKEAIPYLALRNIYEIYQMNPKDSLLIKMVCDFSSDFIDSKNDRISFLKTKTLQEASLEHKLKLDSISKLALKDTTTSTSSKYDRIKTKKNEQAQGFDSTKFYTYGFADVLADANFLKLLRTNEKASSTETDSTDTPTIDDLTGVGSTLIGGKENKLFVIEPTINLQSKKYKNPKVRSKKETELTEVLTDNLLLSCVDNGIALETLTSNDIFTEESTQKLNERNLILSNLKVKGDQNRIHMIPFDYKLLDTLANLHKSELVTFVILNNDYDPEFHGGVYLSSILFPIALPFILAVDIPYCIANGNQTEITYMQMNIRTGEVVTVNREFLRGSLNRLSIENAVHHTFNN